MVYSSIHRSAEISQLGEVVRESPTGHNHLPSQLGAAAWPLCGSTSLDVHWRCNTGKRRGRSSLRRTPRARNTTERMVPGCTTKHSRSTHRFLRSTVEWSGTFSGTTALDTVPDDSHSQHTDCLCKHLVSMGVVSHCLCLVFLSRSLSWCVGYLLVLFSETLCFGLPTSLHKGS